MPAKVAREPDLITQAMKLGGHKTKKAAIETALRRYIAYRKQLGILDLVGKIEYDKDYDYKALRKIR